MQNVREQGAPVGDGRTYFVFRQPVIRGACLLAVVASHIPPLGLPFLAFCVPAFVMMSGFYLSLSNRNERAPGFYRRTLKFLLIPYAFYTLVYAAVRATRGATPVELWRGFLSSDLEQHLWFMPAIIGLYLLHPWLRRLYRKSPAAVCFAALALQTWGWPLAKGHGLLPEGAVRSALSCFAMVGYFVVGYFILDHAQAARRLCESLAGRAACIALWLFWPVVKLSPAAGQVGWPIANVCAAVSVVAAFFVLATVSRPGSRAGVAIAAWVASFGLYSFGIYLIHPLVVAAVSRGVTRLTGVGGGAPWGVLVLVVTAPVALLLVKWIANRPLGRYIT